MNTILGKTGGTIFQRKNTEAWSVAVTDKVSGKKYSKQIGWKTNGGKEKAYEIAKVWLNKTCLDNNIIKNHITYIDENTIQVKLTKDQIMITDAKFLDLCMKISLFSTKGGNENASYYACTYIDGKNIGFHNYITGFQMVDHINRNTMDNRLSNLRQADYKINNNNRTSKVNTSGFVGVSYNKKDNCWRARIKQDGIEYSKSFSILKYGDSEAKQMAINYREELNQKYDCHNTLQPENYNNSPISLAININCDQKNTQKEANDFERFVENLTQEAIQQSEKEAKIKQDPVKEDQSAKIKQDIKKEDQSEKNVSPKDVNFAEHQNRIINEKLISEVIKLRNELEELKKAESIGNKKQDEEIEEEMKRKKEIALEKRRIRDRERRKRERGEADVDENDREEKISTTLREYYTTEEGKESKKKAFEKRSETMEKQRNHLRSSITEKTCGSCNETLSIENFHKKASSKDGLQTNCKKCVNSLKKHYKTLKP